MVDHTAQLGGGEVALYNLVTAMDRRRYAPSVLLFADGPLRAKLAASGVDVTVLPLGAAVSEVRKEGVGLRSLLSGRRAWEVARFLPRVRAAIHRSGAALVHTNSLKSDVLAGLAGRWAQVPVVWHVRDRIADDYLPPAVASAFRRAAAVVPDHVIAISDAVRQTLGQHPADAGRVHVVHDGTGVVAPSPPLPDGTDPPVVGLIGRMTPWKGQLVFLDAAARVRRRFPTARFRLIGSALFGEADYERRVRARAEEPDLAGSVELLGFCADVPACLVALDVLVHASVTGEPFGQVVIEGMAAARPVVATAGGGIPEIVVDGESGLLVPMGDATGMADAIVRLLADPALRRALGEAARARVVDRFTVQQTARGVEAVYDQMLGRPRPQGTHVPSAID